jgi:siroheme synthase (precorrin-2 oxidase/ferrochelatase)
MKKPYFPMFVDLSGRQVTVVGGGSVALRRSETLLYFGVDIKVIAPEIRSEFYRLVYEECQKAHIPVNTADDRELCDFYFPSVVLTEDIVIGLNSIDHDPKKVKEARKIIENVFDNERDYRS